MHTHMHVVVRKCSFIFFKNINMLPMPELDKRNKLKLMENQMKITTIVFFVVFFFVTVFLDR